MAEATALVADLTKGVMADSAILTVGLSKGPMIDEALDIVRKGGAVVLTGIAADRRQHADPADDCASRCSRSDCWAASTARPTRAPTSRGC